MAELSPYEGYNPETHTTTIEGVLRHAASEVATNETAITSGNAGYSAYTKRMDLARAITTRSPRPYAASALAGIQKSVSNIFNLVQNGQMNYDYFCIQNGYNVLFNKRDLQTAGFSGIASVGQQIFDDLAGVTQADLL